MGQILTCQVPILTTMSNKIHATQISILCKNPQKHLRGPRESRHKQIQDYRCGKLYNFSVETYTSEQEVR